MMTGDYTTINSDWSASESGRGFPAVEDGSPSKPFISTEHYAGLYSLGIQVPTDASGNKQRFEFKIVQATDADGLHFDNARYSGFAFKIAAAPAPFGSSTIFWQAWQGSPWGPPASLKFASDSSAPYRLRLCIRNMSTGPDSAVPDLEIWSGSMIYPDTWYSVVLYLAPRYDANGNIKLWINGTNYADWTGNIGYDPSQISGASNGLDLKNGLYQPDTNNGHTFYFDQIMLADSYAEAAALPYTNRPPTAAPGSVSTLRNTAVNVDLRSLVSDFETPVSQCRFAVSGVTNGTATLLPDGATIRFAPATGFVGNATFGYTATDLGESVAEFLHYSFEPPDSASDGYATDNSGRFHDGTLLTVGQGAFAYSSDVPLTNADSASLQLTESGALGAARLARFVSPAELNLSDSDWTFGAWFQRSATTNHDFLFYLGTGNGFGGSGDELQLYGPNGSSVLRLQHYNSSNALDVDVASAAVVSAGQWHHAALVFHRTNTNAGQLGIFLDGTQVAVTNVSWLLQQQAPLVFGGHNDTNSSLDRWFNGRLDDIVLFSTALSASEISRLASGTVSQFGGRAATNSVSVSVTNYLKPTLSAISFPGGAASLLVNGSPGASYTVMASSNLVDWTPLLVSNPPAVPFRFTDPSASGAPRRFYRASAGP